MGFQTSPDPNNPKLNRISWPTIGASHLAAKGIVLDVAISTDMLTASMLQTGEQNVPQPFLCKALVDTGASGLAIDKSIAISLGLKRKSVATNLTANGSKLSPVYFVSLTFPGTTLKSYDLSRATEGDLAKQSFQCLIGRETMANWHLHHNGQSGQISISD